MVLVKNLKFCERFVLCKIHLEKAFGDLLVRKQAFLDKTNMNFKKKGKIGIFTNGIVHDFGQKVVVFSSFAFIKIHQENVFGDVLDKKEAFKDYKHNCVRKT